MIIIALASGFILGLIVGAAIMGITIIHDIRSKGVRE